MIVKDEAGRLGRCLESVGSLRPEIIIADTGSQDSTPDIARSYGAKVMDFDFKHVDFAAARNYTLEQARGEWILVLDADECLQRESIATLRQLMVRGENAGYYFERLNYSADADAPATDYSVRLFPNRPGYRYRGRVHETIHASILSGGGRVVQTGIRIDHEFAIDTESRRLKNHRYLEILKQEIAADPNDFSRLDFLAAEYHQLGMFDEAAEIAERIATVRPLDPLAHLNAGVYHLLFTQEHERARADFLKALELRPDYREARSFLETLQGVTCPA